MVKKKKKKLRKLLLIGIYTLSEKNGKERTIKSVYFVLHAESLKKTTLSSFVLLSSKYCGKQKSPVLSAV